VHHGDGTQSIFAADADLWYGSTHQSPLFPGTGAVEERGIGPARGTKHNVPLPPGAGDEALLLAWRDELLPALEAFAPDAILASAGYDATGADPLAALRVSDAGYRELGLALGEVVQRLQLPGIALALEGGYDLAALASGVAATLVGLLAGMRPAGGAHLYSGPR
jgi:acetoin utilization deacetylase AcuC-like enzyme